MRYHHLPDVSVIQPFYEDLFGWQFTPMPRGPWGPNWPVWSIHHLDGTLIARAEETPETVRGHYRCLMPCFASDLSGDAIAQHGFTLLSDLGQGRRIIADRQGASLMLAPVAGDAARP